MPGNSHALRRRCPCCKRIRKNYEPDGNHGGEHHRLRGPGYPFWITTPFGRCCGFCVVRYITPEVAASLHGAIEILDRFVSFFEKPLKANRKYADLNRAKQVLAHAVKLRDAAYIVVTTSIFA